MNTDTPRTDALDADIKSNKHLDVVAACAFWGLCRDLERENVALRQLVEEAVKIQSDTYGNGTKLHLSMIDWSKKAKALNTESK